MKSKRTYAAQITFLKCKPDGKFEVLEKTEESLLELCGNMDYQTVIENGTIVDVIYSKRGRKLNTIFGFDEDYERLFDNFYIVKSNENDDVISLNCDEINQWINRISVGRNYLKYCQDCFEKGYRL